MEPLLCLFVPETDPSPDHFLHSKCLRLIDFKVYYLLLLVCLSLDGIEWILD